MDDKNNINAGQRPYHQLLTESQSALYAFVCTLLGGSSGSYDVLQETNMVLWEKADDFDVSRPFLPWALQFARLQVLAYRKRMQRDRLMFSTELMELLESELHPSELDTNVRLEALEQCLQKLTTEQRNLIRWSYEYDATVSKIGQWIGKSAEAVASQLYRVRKSLMVCIESRIRLRGHHG